MEKTTAGTEDIDMKHEVDILIQHLSDEWRIIESSMDGYKLTHRTEKLSVIISIAIEDDAKRWIHVSFARPNRMPDYYDMKNIKNAFLPNRKAIMVLPKDDKHINIHSYCLHLFHCLDGDGLAEFSGFRADVEAGKVRTL